ncbi:MAG: hypothetical protein ACXVZ2_04285 [Gaiellaceae bacterium]
MPAHRLTLVTDLFRFVQGYEHYVFRAGREPLFFLLLAFLLTFVAARAYTRVGRARGWGSGSVRGVHLHHLVPGIIACLAAGTAIIAFRPGGYPLLALSSLFGIGAALVLDEFALILHLDDVYWTDAGRSSIEATLIGFSLAALCLVTTAPLHADPAKDTPHWALGGIIAVNMVFALIAFLKGKFKLGTFGIFVPGLAVLGACRLAKPDSVWAHSFYGPEKVARSRARSELQAARYVHVRRLLDLIGGAPHLEHHRR